MIHGCGISKKHNKKMGINFLYFWEYELGSKKEKYLGREDDRKAKLRGIYLMLSYYRKIDSEIHRKIGELMKQLTADVSEKNSDNESKKDNYYPELEI